MARRLPSLRLDAVRVEAALERVLTFPSVADKSFLITIADRSVGGLVCRDQMVGRWQVPVADVGVVADSYTGYTGAAMAIGERTPLAVLDAPASGRIAVAEAITNIAAAPIERLSQVKLSANWMAAAGEPGQDADLYATVRAVTQELCIPIGLSIPVGKDSMSMQSIWRDGDRGTHKAVAPLSLIVSAFAPVSDVRGTLTPQLRTDAGASELWLIDLGHGRNRLGGSALAQVYRQLGNQPADLDEAQDLLRLFQLVQAANRQRLLLAYHDRSDGGLAVTLCEMAFSARCGLEIDLPELADTGPGDAGPGGNGADGDDLAWLFNEEPGAVVQLRCTDRQAFQRLLDTYALTAAAQRIGRPLIGDRIVLRRDRSALQLSRTRLHRLWSQTTFQMQRLRDNPETAQQEYDRLLDTADPGLSATLGFDPHDDISAPYRHRGIKPRVAILREQGVNGHLEMAAAFARAGFEPWDVTMHDLSAEASGSRIDLADFKGLAACGGFSFGDVLGAGEGWAKSILFNPQLRDQLQPFFCPRGYVFARRLQRLSNAVGDPRADPRRGALADLFAQCVGAIRVPAGDGGGAAQSVDFVCRYARQPPAHRRRAHRRPHRLSTARRPGATAAAAAGLPALHRPRRSTRRALPVQPQRLHRRRDRLYQRRRARHHPDAAPGTRLSQRRVLMAPR